MLISFIINHGFYETAAQIAFPPILSQPIPYAFWNTLGGLLNKGGHCHAERLLHTNQARGTTITKVFEQTGCVDWLRTATVYTK